MSKLKFKQIKKLRPTFVFGGITMVDWFEVSKGKGWCVIRSGLRHAELDIKSPYHYEYFLGGKKSHKKVKKHFNKWWNKMKNYENKN